MSLGLGFAFCWRRRVWPATPPLSIAAAAPSCFCSRGVLSAALLSISSLCFCVSGSGLVELPRLFNVKPPCCPALGDTMPRNSLICRARMRSISVMISASLSSLLRTLLVDAALFAEESPDLRSELVSVPLLLDFSILPFALVLLWPSLPPFSGSTGSTGLTGACWTRPQGHLKRGAFSGGISFRLHAVHVTVLMGLTASPIWRGCELCSCVFRRICSCRWSSSSRCCAARRSLASFFFRLFS